MRSRNSFTLLLGLVFAASLVFSWVGCSSDDPTTTGGVVGDISDPEYIVIKEQIEVFIDSTLGIVKSGFNSTSALATDTLIDPVNYGPLDPRTDSASSVYTNGWHIVFISRLGGGFSTAMLDSIQFRDVDGSNQQTNSDIYSMSYYHDWVFTVHDTSFDHSSYDGNLRLEYANLNTAQATLSGSNTYHIYSKSHSNNPELWPDRSRDITVSGDLVNISINATNSGWSNSCPISGSITGSVEMSTIDGLANPVTSDWTFSLSFTDGEATIKINRGSIYWSATYQACTVPQE